MEEQWGADMKAAVDDLKESARITLGDLHLDAKLFPHLHPHGSGSFRAEDDKVNMQK